VRAVWAGIRRVKGTAQQGKAAAVTDDVRAMVVGLPDTLRGHRDRALLLLGFAGAFRRSELGAFFLPEGGMCQSSTIALPPSPRLPTWQDEDLTRKILV